MINKLNYTYRLTTSSKINYISRSMHRIKPTWVTRAIPPTSLTSPHKTGLSANPSNSRGMASVYGATWKHGVRKPRVKDTDMSGKHKICLYTKCWKKNCAKENCADPNNSNIKCPNRTAQQNQTSIPPTSQGFTTTVVGNTTSTIPQGKNGFTIDKNQNYNGQSKPQEMVKESTPPVIDSNDVKIDPASTAFLQAHHDEIKKNIP